MSKSLKALVAGAGVFGGYHAQKYQSLEGIEFLGIFDIDLARAQSAGERLGCGAFGPENLDEALKAADIITIATPAFAHKSLAVKALSMGLHVYSEKPVAATNLEVEAMVEAARAHNRVLAVGHQERAVFEAMGLYGVPSKPLRLEAVRNGTVSTRNLDVSVTLDLMVHDLDLALTLADAGANSVQSVANFRKEEGYKAVGADEMTADVVFEGGMSAQFQASRMAEARERTMRIVYPEGEVFIDLLNRRFENSTPFALNPDFAEDAIAKDPLGTSVKRFIEAVNGERATPLCSGIEGAKALELAMRIDG